MFYPYIKVKIKCVTKDQLSCSYLVWVVNDNKTCHLQYQQITKSIFTKMKLELIFQKLRTKRQLLWWHYITMHIAYLKNIQGVAGLSGLVLLCAPYSFFTIFHSTVIYALAIWTTKISYMHNILGKVKSFTANGTQGYCMDKYDLESLNVVLIRSGEN